MKRPLPAVDFEENKDHIATWEGRRCGPREGPAGPAKVVLRPCLDASGQVAHVRLRWSRRVLIASAHPLHTLQGLCACLFQPEWATPKGPGFGPEPSTFLTARAHPQDSPSKNWTPAQAALTWPAATQPCAVRGGLRASGFGPKYKLIIR